MDAGGLAHMTPYNNFHQNAGPSYRGKGSHLRNISVPVSSNNLAAPAAENEPAKTPRSARSALLANLRTAPKTPNPTPTSAPMENGLSSSKYAVSNNTPTRYDGGYQNGVNHYQPQIGLPTPPSASPAINYNEGQDQVEEMDAETYAQLLMQQNYYLQQQQILQQQLTAQKVQQLQQQLAQLQMQSGAGYSATPPMSPGMGGNQGAMGIYGNGLYNMYNAYQQQQQQSYIQTQGLQTQYNQYSPQQQQVSPPIPSAVEVSPPTPQDQAPPVNVLSMAANTRASNRSRSPPKLNLQQSNASTASSGFRRGHRKASSLSTCTTLNNIDIAEAPKTAVPRSMLGGPSTPMTATFGPGHASGTHPLRQPRGPPSIEELKEKPISTVEGSKNFATRQRRRAVSRLVTAGMERRSARSTSGSVGGTMTPVSENDGFNFDENESVSSSVSAVTGRQSRQSLRELEYSNSSDDGTSSTKESSGLKAPKLVLSAAEKRKSALF
jgi:hypothetical protein